MKLTPLISVVLAGWTHFAAATCIESLVSATPTTDFTVADDIVIHKTTGLMWSRCSLGLKWNSTAKSCAPESGTPYLYSWIDAQKAAQLSRLGQFSDWRLPNKNELISIVDHACTGPAINEAIFPATPLGSFWTSTASAVNAGQAWRVVFTAGDLINDDTTSKLYVRLVREP